MPGPGPVLGPDATERPLFGPGGRIPAVAAIDLAPPSAITALRQGWRGRHTASMVALTPVLFWIFRSSLGPALAEPIASLVVAVLALAGALLLTSYLPLPGTQRGAQPCAVIAGLAVPCAAILLGRSDGLPPGALAAAVLALGLWQRLSGTSACG